MSEEEIRAIVERITLGECLTILRAIAEKHCPGAEYAALSVKVGNGVPDICLTVIPQNLAPSSRPTPLTSSSLQSQV